jgi:4-amino-4-deoxychorismate lyase
MASESDPGFELFTSLRFDPLLETNVANREIRRNKLPFAKFYMFPFHHDRLVEAAKQFGWFAIATQLEGSAGLDHLHKELCNYHKDWESIDKPLRVKVLLGKLGVTAVERSDTPEVTEFNLFPKRLPPPRSTEPTMEVSPLTGGALYLGPSDSISGDPPRKEYWDVIPDTARTKPSPYTSYKTTSRAMYDSARKNVGIESMSEKREVLITNESGEIMEGSLTSVYFWRNGKWVTPGLESGGQAGTTRRWALEKK